jgi:predicted MPP superfamily phosphohydrolase
MRAHAVAFPAAVIFLLLLTQVAAMPYPNAALKELGSSGFTSSLFSSVKPVHYSISPAAVPLKSQESTHEPSPVTLKVKITNPTLTVPLIIARGNVATIIVESNATSSSVWEANLSSRYDSVVLPLADTPVELSPDNWRVNVTVSASARPDLYDLNIAVDGIPDAQPHAVSVVELEKPTFQFVHVTDVHIGALATGSAYDNFLSFADEINLIRPEFVVMTGDDCDKYLSAQEFPPTQQDEKLVECLKRLNVPVYVGSGNHDWSYVNSSDPLQNIERYRAIVNDRLEFSFDYGQCRFDFVDTGKYSPVDSSTGLGITNESLALLRSDLENHSSSTQRFVMIHHPAYPDWLTQNNAEFRQMMVDLNVSMVLSGHTHIDDVYEWNGTRMTGGSMANMTAPLHVTTQGMKYSHGYRIIRVNGTNIDSFTYDADGNGARDASSSIPMGKLNATYSPSNNGTVAKVTAKVVNSLREDFTNAYLEFVMPKGPPGTTVSIINGAVWQKIPQPASDVYYVRANITRLGTTNVTLQLIFPVSELACAGCVLAVFSATVLLMAVPRRRE